MFILSYQRYSDFFSSFFSFFPLFFIILRLCLMPSIRESQTDHLIFAFSSNPLSFYGYFLLYDIILFSPSWGEAWKATLKKGCVPSLVFFFFFFCSYINTFDSSSLGVEYQKAVEYFVSLKKVLLVVS